ncbi:MAG TPA: ABC transporter permease [Chryseolinea sp.]
MTPQNPPKLLLRFFRWFCHQKLRDAIEGDLMELYYERFAQRGKRKADLKFMIDVLTLCRPGIIRPIKQQEYINPYAMYRSYFIIGWRNLVKKKGYAFINVGGLAVGMAVSMLIGLWIYDEVSFNKMHPDYERIARVVVGGANSSGPFVQWNTAPPFGNEIRNLYGPQFKYVVMSTNRNQDILSVGDNQVTKTGYYAEPGMAEMLSLKMLRGSWSGLQKKEAVFLSASTAKALFGDADPMNKLVTVVDNKQDLVVTGVYEDISSSSDFRDMTFLGTWDQFITTNAWVRRDDWRQNGFRTFVQLADGANLQVASDKIKAIRQNHTTAEDAVFNFKVFLHPMGQWRLYSDLEHGGGRISLIWLYGSIGLFVLLLACINFMNLATARSEKRAREVGIRKSIGSARSQLVGQFFSESFLVTGFAFIVALCLTQLALPFFNQIAEKEIVLPVSNIFFWLAGIGFCLITGLLAGSYPAFYLSSFNAVNVLKGTYMLGRLAVVPRKVLVVVQFTVSITLMVGVIIVFQQIQFGKDRPVGYSREGLIWVNTPTAEIHQHIDVVREELKKSGAVTEIAESLNTVTNVGSVLNGYDWTGAGPDWQSGFPTVGVASEFGKTVGWEFVEGRDFSRDLASDTTAIVLNETAVKYMNLKDPVDKTIKFTLFDKTRSFKVIGVIKDMLMESPFYPVRKTVYMLDNTTHNLVNIRINPQMSALEALPKIETIFKKYDPTTPFDYKFVDEEYARKFSEEELTGKLAFMFAGLAVFISCLGIFGLASFVAEQRAKEISIRKVLGASVGRLWSMLSKDFALLVVISCVIAAPLSWYFMNDWLQQYEYRAPLSWYVFAGTSVGALIITLITVSYQAVKAALANPVKSLKTE